MQDFTRPLVLVGCGNMAGSILSRWLDCGLAPALVTIVDPARTEAPAGTRLLATLPDSLPEGAIVQLGFKPQQFGQIAPGLRPVLRPGMIVLSMLAGVTVDLLRGALGDAPAIVRMMPNTPVALGKGVCALFTHPQTSVGERDEAAALLAPLGLVEWLEHEDQFNLVTALSGCGPAFLFRFIDALGGAARELGMEADQAARFALGTVEGAAALAALSNQSPAALAEAVASPGGMTREGLDVLDADGRLAALLLDTLRAARDKGEALARAAAQ